VIGGLVSLTPLYNLFAYFLQILDVAAEPGCLFAQQHAFDRQPLAAALPLHHHLCSARDAALWWQIQLWRDSRKASHKLWLFLRLAAHCLSGRGSILCFIVFCSYCLVHVFIHTFGKFIWHPIKKYARNCSQSHHGEKDQFWAACRAKACNSLVAVTSLR